MTNKMLVLGITGPTGAGKGVVSARLRENGVPIIDADLLAREVTTAGHPCLAEIVRVFSPAVLHEDGTLDRAALAAVAFSSPENTARLNAIVHPQVIALSHARLAELKEDGCSLAAIDAPLLFESGMDSACDYTVAVLAPPEQRMARIVARDGLTKERAAARMNAQPNDTYYTERADEILRNDGTLAEFDTIVRDWIDRLREGL